MKIRGVKKSNREFSKGILLYPIGGVLFALIEYLENRIIGSAVEGGKVFLALFSYSSFALLSGALLGLVLYILFKYKIAKNWIAKIDINSLYGALSVFILPFLFVLFEINVRYLPSYKSPASILADIGIAAISLLLLLILYKFFHRYAHSKRRFFNIYISIAVLLDIFVISWLYLSAYFDLSQNLLRLLLLNLLVFAGLILLTNLFYITLKPKLSIKRLAILIALLIFGSVAFFFIGTLYLKPASIPTKEVGLQKENLPNILLITVDTLRADHLSCYGFRKIETPNIDDLAKNGILFEKTISQSPWTTPSLASILTSLHPAVHKAGEVIWKEEQKMFRKIGESIPMLPEILQANGYFTQAILSNPHLTKSQGFAKGFDGFHNFDETFYEAEELFYLRLTANIKSEILNRWYTAGDIITDEAINWLKDNYKTSFFLWIHYTDPHIPYHPPAKYRENISYKGKFRNRRLLDFGRIKEGYYDISPNDREYIENLYNGEIKFTDDQLGRLINKLKELAIFNKTLIILTSDHGEEFWEHLEFEHGHTLYNEQLHVPLIIHFGGFSSSKKNVITQQVRLIDIFPSILEMLKIDYPNITQGESLIPLILNKAQESRIAFSEYLYREKERKSITTDEFKYIYFPDLKREELYDLQQDPAELTNLVTKRREKTIQFQKQIKTIIDNNQKLANILLKAEQAKPIEMNEQLKKQLKALGYIQ